MKISKLKAPKSDISMVFDDFNDNENYYTSLYLHKSEIIKNEDESNQELKIVLDKTDKNDKIVKAMFNNPYGTYIITFLNADFSTAEKAYYSFFIYYGLEALEDDDKVLLKYPLEYSLKYSSTKAFLDFYNKAYELVKNKYIKYQEDLRKTVDFVYKLRAKGIDVVNDKYSRFVAYSQYVDLMKQFNTTVSFRIMKYDSEESDKPKNNRDVEKLAYDIQHKRKGLGVVYLYHSTSHFALAYVALNDLIKGTKRNISICQNCGRYYIQNSGKEIYCNLFNLDGSPTCKSYASKKAYDTKVEEDLAELTYKRENQRRMTQVYRAKNYDKEKLAKIYSEWKTEARNRLKAYRLEQISMEDFCNWLEENKNK